jgi:hypothetical protein
LYVPCLNTKNNEFITEKRRFTKRVFSFVKIPLFFLIVGPTEETKEAIAPLFVGVISLDFSIAEKSIESKVYKNSV